LYQQTHIFRVFFKISPERKQLFFCKAIPFIITLSDCFIKQYNGKEEEEKQQQQQVTAFAEAMMRQKR